MTSAALNSNRCYNSGNKLGGDLGEIVSLQTQTSPYFQLREKFKCIEHIGKGKPKLLPEIRKSEENFSIFQVPVHVSSLSHCALNLINAEF